MNVPNNNKTTFEYVDLLKPIDVYVDEELIGNEVDVFRPHVGYKKPEMSACARLTKLDGCCGCVRAIRLAGIKKADLKPVSDEVLNKIIKHWEELFCGERPSFENLKRQYNET
jgi:hypothetical protein